MSLEGGSPYLAEYSHKCGTGTSACPIAQRFVSPQNGKAHSKNLYRSRIQSTSQILIN